MRSADNTEIEFLITSYFVGFVELSDYLIYETLRFLRHGIHSNRIGRNYDAIIAITCFTGDCNGYSHTGDECNESFHSGNALQY